MRKFINSLLKKMKSEEISKIFLEIAELLDIKGVAFKPLAYRRAAKSIQGLDDPSLSANKKIAGVGKSISEKIKEYLKTGKIKYFTELKEETAIQQIITHFFQTKGISLPELKYSAKRRKIIYSRFTKPAKQLLELATSVEKAKEAMDKVATWANSRNLDYAIETVFKKWLELDRLKPKEVVKKPFYKNLPMIWSETKKQWYVISPEGEWLEFAGKKEDMEWRIIK
jgi:hypothetical protein